MTWFLLKRGLGTGSLSSWVGITAELRVQGQDREDRGRAGGGGQRAPQGQYSSRLGAQEGLGRAVGAGGKERQGQHSSQLRAQEDWVELWGLVGKRAPRIALILAGEGEGESSCGLRASPWPGSCPRKCWHRSRTCRAPGRRPCPPQAAGLQQFTWLPRRV